jgi:transposase, IS5 family
MRSRFNPQTELGCLSISDVQFSKQALKSRDEMPAVLLALHHIFITPELNERIFEILENSITKAKKPTGRKGMDLWHILVLAITRQANNTDWDKLHDWSNNHQKLREVLGVFNTGSFVQHKQFELQCIKDNVKLLKLETLLEINQVIAEVGIEMIKKKPSGECEMKLKVDSYALETNIHFPMDLNLLWDSMRKSLDVVKKVKDELNIGGWRKVKSITNDFKKVYRNTTNAIYKSRNEQAKSVAVKLYLSNAKSLIKRVETIKPYLMKSDCQKHMLALLTLEGYIAFANKFIDQIDRRLLKKQEIPSSEKIYSIFEPHTEWITKGKIAKKVELGHLVNIATAQNGIIVDVYMSLREKDPAQVKPLMERLSENLPNYVIIKSASFDKGFFSRANYETVSKAGVEQVIMPKKGKKNIEEKERENTKEFKKLRNEHSAIESSINMLEHHGLNRCPDKGLYNLKRYVLVSVIAMNLHLIGNELKNKKIKEFDKAEKKRLKNAA